jgi:hypothetical protein
LISNANKYNPLKTKLTYNENKSYPFYGLPQKIEISIENNNDNNDNGDNSDNVNVNLLSLFLDTGYTNPDCEDKIQTGYYNLYSGDLTDLLKSIANQSIAKYSLTRKTYEQLLKDHEIADKNNECYEKSHK